MTNRFLISVAAAALIAGTGFANAQGTGMNREGGAGGAVQQSAPPSDRGGAPSARQHREESPSGMKSTQSEPKAPGAVKNKQAEDNMKGPKSQPSTASETDRAKGGKDMKAEGREGKSGTVGQAPADKSGSTTQNREGMKAQDRDGMNAQGQKGSTDTNRAQTNQGSQTTTTTGQAGAGGKLSTEQRTKITTVIKSQRVEPVTSVNFSIAVGTRVPRDVRFHPLPAEVVTIYPEWRGYEFVLVRDQILVIDPRTFEIVAILEA